MINPEDETIIVNVLSCTKDGAVAKMLGWMRSSVRLKYIKVTSLGIQPDQLEHMHSIEGSILDLLNEQRESSYLFAGTLLNLFRLQTK